MSFPKSPLKTLSEILADTDKFIKEKRLVESRQGMRYPERYVPYFPKSRKGK